jgi:DNA-binding transcriptional LysR family regulator
MPFRRGHLRYFVTVADEGQITRAAHKLHIAQPALSQAISQLESELGIELLIRHARGVSLTLAGEVFLPKARAALAADAEAALAAQSLARAAGEKLEIGYAGAPPAMKIPELFSGLQQVYPDVEVNFRELSFPRGATSDWLGDVDAALCHRPADDPAISLQVMRHEPRAVVTYTGHRLAHADEVDCADLSDEMFIGYDDTVQAEWVAFHDLDEERGGRPAMTEIRARRPADMFMLIASRQALTVIPTADAAILLAVLRGIVAIPVRDAPPSLFTLVWRTDNPSPLVRTLAQIAETLSDSEAEDSAGPSQAPAEGARAAKRAKDAKDPKKRRRSPAGV